jgi:hypothetical protein
MAIDTTSLYGSLIGAHHVEDAAVSVYRKWLPTYLHEVERQTGLTINPLSTPGSIAKPRSYRVSSDVEKMPEDQTPAIVIRSPGVADHPLKNGAGIYQAQFTLEASAVVSAIGTVEANGEPRALLLARMYALALRACLVQQPDDAGYLYRRDWVDESYDVLPSIDDRTICVGKTTFQIEVPNVTDANSGPVEPLIFPDDPDVTPPVPSPQWPIATEADVDLIKVPLDEEMT